MKILLPLLFFCSWQLSANSQCVITSQPVAPAPICLNGVGSAPVLTVSVSGGGPTYQWYSNTVNHNTGGTIAAGFSTGASYEAPFLSPGTVYYYAVVTTNCGVLTSNTAPVTVTNGITITTQPATPQPVCVGGTIAPLTIVVSGVNPTYQWYSNSVNSNSGGTLIPGANGSSYTPSTSQAGTVYYFVTVWGQCGTNLIAASIPVTVTINPGIGTAITRQPPTTMALCSSGTASLSVEATGSNLHYQWFRNNSNSYNGATSISSTPILNLAFTSTQYYFVTVTGDCGSVTSNITTVYGQPLSPLVTASNPGLVCINSNGPTLSASPNAVGEQNLSWQWYSNSTNSNTGGTAITGATASSYIPPTNVAGTLYYYVSGVGHCGGAASNPVAVTVNAGNGTLITSQPASESACLNGGPNPLTVVASGDNLHFQWINNGPNNSTVGGVTAGGGNQASYIPPANTVGTNYYYVSVIGSCGLVNSRPVAVNIVGGTSIITQPQSPPTVCLNGNAETLSVLATGSNLVYQWYKNSVPIDGATTANYLPSTATAGQNAYYVIVTGDCGSPQSVKSSTVNVSVAPGNFINGQTTGPVVSCVQPGTTTTLSINPSVSGPPLFQWYSNTTNSNNGGMPINGATGASYAAPLNSIGTTYYYATIGSSCGTVTSNPIAVIANGAADLSVTPAPAPLAPVCVNGNPPTLIPNVTGSSISGYLWLVSSDTLHPGSAVSNTGPSYTPDISVPGTFYYRAAVSSSTSQCPTFSTWIPVTVNSGGVSILTQPAQPNAVCTNGYADSLAVSASGIDLGYQWYSNNSNSNSGGQPIDGATGRSYLPPTSSVGTTWYYVTVTTDCGSPISVSSGPVSVAVGSGNGTVITTQPIQPPVLCQNGTVPIFSVSATGDNLHYQWFINNTNSNQGASAITGANASSYAPSTPSVGTMYYYVLVSGDCGQQYSIPVSVTFAVTTSILTQPVSETICLNGAGQVAPLSVVTGGSNLTYQWYSNSSSSITGGTAISGANASSYQPTPNNPGTTWYYVVASGDCGSATSSAASVTAVNGTSITVQPDLSPRNCDGSFNTLSVTATGSNLSYQWWASSTGNPNTFSVIPGANSNVYSLPKLSTQAFYYVVISGDCGSPATVQSHTVIVQPNTNSGTAVITRQPVAPAPVCTNPAPVSLSVTATNATFYSLFVNSSNSRLNARLVLSSPNPLMVVQPAPGTFYYFIVASGNCGNDTSTIVPVTYAYLNPQLHIAGLTQVCRDGQGPVFSVFLPPSTVGLTPSGLSYQWYSSATNNPSQATPIDGATNISFAPITNEPGTTFYSVAIADYCNTTIISTLPPVLVAATQGTIITSQPAATTSVCVNGSPVSLSVLAAGANVSYQWFSNSVNTNTGGHLINGETGNSYAAPVAVAGTNYYYVTVTSDCGSVSSNPATVNVVPGTTIIEQPAFNAQGTSSAVCINGQAPTLSVVASGSNLSYQWYSNGSNSNSGGTLVLGATASSYQPPVNSVGQTWYYVQVSGDCGSPLFVNSNAVLISVVGNASISGNSFVPALICGPSGNVPISFSITTSGLESGAQSFTWYSSAIKTNSGGTLFANTTSPTLSLTPTQVGTTYYYLRYNDYCGIATSNPVAVNISLPPAIANQPVGPAAVCVNTATPEISVTASGSNINYQWFSNSSNSNSGGTAIPNSNNSVLLPSTSTPGNTYYYVTITGDCGTVTSNVVPFTVVGGTSIVTQPISPAPVCSNGTAPVLTVAAQGIHVNIQWYSNTTNSNTGGSLISGATGNGYSPAVNATGTVYYYAVATGDCGSPLSVASNAIAVVVTGGTSIIDQPVSPDPVCVNGTFSSLSVNATGGDLTYQWYSNSTANNSGGTLISAATNAIFTPLAGSVGTIYYYVIVTGDCGAPLQATSNAVAATVIGGTVITGQPNAPQAICLNGQAPVLSVAASGSNLVYQWYSNTTNSNTGGVSIPGANGNTYTPDISTEGNTYYYAVVTGDCGSPLSVQSNAVPVTVIGNLSITVQPVAPPSVCINVTAPILSVSARGVDLSYQWYSNGSNSNSGGSPVNGETGSSFTPVITSEGTVWYYVVVTSDCGSPSSIASNAVPVTVTAQTSITTQPVSPAPVCQGGTAPILTVTATGNNTYQWYANTINQNFLGAPINGATGPTYTVPVNNPGTLYYYVVVTGSCSGDAVNVTSDFVTVVVNSGNGTAITMQPVAPGELCLSSAPPVLSITATAANAYQWYSNMVNSNSGGTTINGANASSYTAPVTSPGVTWYYAVVTGTCGSATSNAVAVSIGNGTAITAQPVQPLAVCANGVSPVLTVAATGANIGYQWYSNSSNSNSGGAPIVGANGNQYTPSVSVPGNTWYYVLVTGDCGSIASNAVEVSVVTGVSITTQPASQTAVCLGNAIPSLSVSASGTGLSYQWYSNTVNNNTTGSLISGATGNTYTPQISVAGTTYFYVVVTGSCGSPLSATSNTAAVVVSGGTVITAQPASQSGICVGGSALPLHVNAIGGTISYQWFSNNMNSNSGGSLINGATGSSYTPLVNAPVTTYYYVVVTGTCGSPLTVTSNTAAIAVNGGTAISKQPASPAPVCVNGTAPALTVAATGGDLVYQWYSNSGNSNTGGTFIPGAASASFSPSVTAVGTFYYYVVVSGDCGSPANVTSNVVAVIVKGGTAIISQPVQPNPVCIGDVSTVLSVTASGAQSYQWYRNTTNNNSGGSAITNANGSSYAPPVSASGTIYYYVIVTGDCGTVTSNAVSVTVNQTTAINAQPVSPNPVCVNGTIAPLTVDAAGSNLQYQWFVNTLNDNTNGSSVSGANSSSYNPPSNVAGTLYYYVSVTGDCNTVVSNVATVAISQATVITTQPATPDPLCSTGTAPVLSVTASGAGTPSYQWYSNASNNNTGGTMIANTNSNTYTPDISGAGTRYYYVTVTGGCGSVASNAVPVVVKQPTAIGNQPVAPASVCAGGQSPTLSVTATGTGTLVYQWYSNNTNSNANGSAIQNANLSTYNPPIANAGTIYYYVTITGDCGSVTSNAVPVVVNSSTSITTQPVSPAPVCQTVSVGTLTVSANGPGLGYQWYSNATNDNSGGTLINGATATAYSPPSTTAGTLYYYVAITGSCGTLNSDAVTVTVKPITAITQDLVGPASVCLNETVPALSVGASGSNLQYKWYSNAANSDINGALIAGAITNSYTPSTSQVGTVYYYVVVSGDCGSLPSSAVAVTVNPTTRIVNGPIAPIPVCVNQAIPALTVSATGSNLHYQWFSNNTSSNTGGNVIATATTNSFTPSTSVSGTIYYYVVVSGDCGSLPSSAVAVTVNPATAIGSGPIAPDAICLNGTIPALSVSASGSNLHYQWYSNNGNNNSGGTLIALATNSSYLPSTSVSGTIYYYVVVSGDCGSLPSSAVAVTVNPATSIGSGPIAPDAICLNGTVPALSVSASGSNLHYQWYSNNANNNSGGTLIALATNSSYLPSTSQAGTNYYYVVVSGDCGSLPSTAVAVTVNPATSIGSGPIAPDAICLNGTIPALSVSASGSNLHYQWYSNNADNNSGGTLIALATNSSYLPSTSVSGIIYYYVVVSGDCGSLPSSAVAVTVNPATSIGSGPIAPDAICLNGTIPALSVSASGSNLHYQWYSNNGNNNSGGTLIALATNSSYLPSTSQAGTIYYYVVVTGDCGTVTSNAVPVTINSSTSIITQPVSPAPVCQTVSVGTLTVSANGPGLNYQWYSNAANSNNGGTLINGATTPDYSPPSIVAGTVYYYTVISGSCGILNSDAVAVTVKPITAITQDLVTPASICVNEAIPALSVSAIGSNLHYQWYSNNTNSNIGGTMIASATANSYSPPTNQSGTFNYYVVVSGDCGSLPSSAVTITVNPTTAIGSGPVEPAPVCLNGTIPALSVSATGSNLHYQWYINNTNSNTGGAIIAAATANSYSPPTNQSGTFNYYVVVSGDCGSLPSSAVTVTVNPTTAIVTVPVAPAPVCLNGIISALSVTATGTNLGYQWYSNNTNNNTSGSLITGATINTYTPPTNVAGTVYYYVVVSGDCGILPSNAVAITVNPGPTITTEPVSPGAVCLNGTITALSVAASGTSLGYQWYSNSLNSNTGGSLIATANGNTYLPPVSTAGTTYYYVTVSGDCGSVSSNAVGITVNAGPTISGQPVAPLPVCINSNSPVLSVTALGATQYQWYKNSVNSNSGGTQVLNATGNTYAPPVSVAGTIFYYVVVSANCGSVASNAVALTVNASVAIYSQPQAPAAICANGTAPQLSVGATGTSLTYQWYSNATNTNTGGSAVNAAITSTFTVPTSTAGTFYYYAVVGSSCGSVASNAVKVTVNSAPNASITAATSVCTLLPGNKASVVSAGTGASYVWTISNGTITAGANTNSITYTSGSSGSVSLSITVTNSGGCKASASAAVPIVTFPNATISTTASVCASSTGNSATVVNAGTGVSYGWIITNGTITSGGSTGTITYTAGSSGSVTLVVVVINSSGCKLSLGAKQVSIVAAPNATITAAAVCPSSTGNSASVPSGGTGASYLWTISNGTITSINGTNSVVYTAGSSGTVTLGITVTNSTGCKATGTKQVSINTAPNATITAASPVCATSTGNTASVASAGNGAVYVWSISNGTITSGSGTSGIKYTAAAQGSVILTATVTASSGCKSTGSKTVVINAPVVPLFSQIGPLCRGAKAPTLPATSNNGISGTWNPSKISTTSNGTTAYRFTPATGNCAGTTTMNIVVQTCTVTLGEEKPEKIIPQPELDAEVLPNPTQYSFTLRIKGNRSEVAEIRVFDMLGRKLDQMRASTGTTLQFGGNYVHGMYIIEILQGPDRKVLKAIKD